MILRVRVIVDFERYHHTLGTAARGEKRIELGLTSTNSACCRGWCLNWWVASKMTGGEDAHNRKERMSTTRLFNRSWLRVQ